MNENISKNEGEERRMDNGNGKENNEYPILFCLKRSLVFLLSFDYQTISNHSYIDY